MSWISEDWRPCLVDSGGEPRFELRQVRELLLRIPGRDRMTLASLDGESLGGLDLADDFGRVLALDPTRISSQASQAAEGCRKFDVVTALESLPTRDRGQLDQQLRDILACMVEGGVLLAGFPAAARIGGPVELKLGERGMLPHGALHEVELQYRMTFAGYQGVRIQRFSANGNSPGILLCMAVRRAFN